MRWALYVTLAPAWFDPGEVAGGFLTPFWVLYAMHDALVKPMPGNLMAPSLAESWTVSPDQRVYEFKLREGLKFHNGDPFTADDVKFSFQRSKVGKALKDRVREVEIVGPHRVRFHLHEPFPDFMAYYGTLASGAGWIVPKKYVERVGDDGFKKQPVGLGPYKFVSHTPGVELVMEAYEGYWRKMPSVKRLVFKTVPDPTTRAAMLKNGEVDVAYMLDAPAALELKRDPNFRLGFSGASGSTTSTSSTSGTRSRRGTTGACGWPPTTRSTGRRSTRRRRSAPRAPPAAWPRARSSSRWRCRPTRTIPPRPSSSSPRPAIPNGFDGGDFYPYPPYSSAGETIVDYFGAVGIRCGCARWSGRPSRRRGRARSSTACACARWRTSATRPRGWPTWCRARARTRAAPIRTWTRSSSSRRARPTGRSARPCSTRSSSSSTTGCASARSTSSSGPSGIGPRVAEPGLMLIDPYPWSAPLEEVRLGGK